MHLIQLFLPLYDNDGQAFAKPLFDTVRGELTERFGGVTQSAEIDTRVDVPGVDAKRTPVRRFGVKRCADTFERDAEFEPVVRALREPRREDRGLALGQGHAFGVRRARYTTPTGT